MAKETKREMIMENIKRNVLPVAMAIITLIITILGTCVSYLQFREAHTSKETDISARLKLITESLSQDADELRSIETELENRIAYVQELKSQAELAESVLNVSETQLNAIHSMIKEELESNNQKNAVPTILNNSFFCIVGMVVPPLLKRIYNKIKK